MEFNNYLHQILHIYSFTKYSFSAAHVLYSDFHTIITDKVQNTGCFLSLVVNTGGDTIK